MTLPLFPQVFISVDCDESVGRRGGHGSTSRTGDADRNLTDCWSERHGDVDLVETSEPGRCSRVMHCCLDAVDGDGDRRGRCSAAGITRRELPSRKRRVR